MPIILGILVGLCFLTLEDAPLNNPMSDKELNHLIKPMMEHIFYQNINIKKGGE